jgi:hypothetical protein
MALDLTSTTDEVESDFHQTADEVARTREQIEKDRQKAAEAARRNSNIRCISVSGSCTGIDCVIEDIKISDGPGDIDNSWSSPSICTGYNGLEGSYGYVMRTNFDRVCSGTFQVTKKAKSGVTVNVYDTCSFGYVSEY